MTQLARSVSQPPPSRPAWLPKTKGLLGIGKLPSVLPGQLAQEAAGQPAGSGGNGGAHERVHGRLSILACLLRLSLALAFNRRFRPSRLPATLLALAAAFGRFQGFWYELGQLLAQRISFADPLLRQQFLHRCQPGSTLTLAQVQAAVHENLGAPVAALFSRIDALPVRLGNYTQSYRATLRREGAEVELKIRRAGLEARLKRDLSLFRLISRLLHLWRKERSNVFDELIDIYAERLPALLDLRYEASAMRRMRRSLRPHKIHVAKLYRGYLSQSVLVHEHIAAPTLQDLIDLSLRDGAAARRWCNGNQIDLERAGRRLYHSIFRQICEDNFFNQNLSPSNLLVLRGHAFAVISCDASASLDKRFLTIFNLAMAALARDAYEKFVDTLFLLCDSLPPRDLSGVRAELIRIVRTHAARSALEAATHEEKSLVGLTVEVAAVLHRNGIVLDRQMVKLMAAIGSVDAAVSFCAPCMNHRVELERYARKAVARQVRGTFKEGVGKALMGVVSPLVEMVRFETASMRKKAQAFRASTGKLSYLGAALLRWVGLALVVGGLCAVWVYLNQHHAESLGAVQGTAASDYARQATWLPSSWWLVIFIGFVAVLRTVRQLVHRLAEKDVDVGKDAN